MTLRKKDYSLMALAIMCGLAAGPSSLTKDLIITAVFAQSTPNSTPLPVPSGVDLKIDGSGSMTTINKALKDSFESKYPGKKVEINYSNTPDALKALAEGKVDVVAVGRSLTKEEKAGLVVVPITRNKIAVFVSESNPFSQSITDQNFAKIFRGEIKDWSELGGKSGKIRFIDRPENSDTRTSLSVYPSFQSKAFVAGDNAVKVATDSTDDIIAKLGKDGISYGIVDQVIGVPGVKILAMHKVLPSDPKYPFSQPLAYVYKQGNSNQVVQDFIGYATAGENNKLIEDAIKTGVISNKDTQVKPDGKKPNSSIATDGKNDAAKNTTDGKNDAAKNTTDGKNDPKKDEVKNTTDGKNDPKKDEVKNTTDGKNDPKKDEVKNTTDGKNDAVKTTENSNSKETKSDNINIAGGGDNQNNKDQNQDKSNLPWWLIPLALVGGVGGWFLLGKKGEPGANVGGTAVAGIAAIPPKESRLILVARNCQEAYGYWEVDQAIKDKLKEQGGNKLTLRLYDVTDQSINNNAETTHIKQFDCHENDQDLHLPIPVDNRDYLVELGYLTNNNQWLKIARSTPIRIPACIPSTTPGATLDKNINLPVAATAAAISAIPATLTDKSAKQQDLNRVILVPRNGKEAYAYWEVEQDNYSKKLALRLYDVTHQDIDEGTLHYTKQFDCNENEQDLHFPVPLDNRDYLVELGYLTTDNQWSKIARSSYVRVPEALPTPEELAHANEGILPTENDQIPPVVGTETTGKIAPTIEAKLPTENAPINPVVGTEQTKDLSPTIEAKLPAENASINPVVGTAKTAPTIEEKSPAETPKNDPNINPLIVAAATAATAATAAKVIGKSQTETDTINKPKRLILVSRNNKEVDVYWELNQNQKDNFHAQGGEKLAVRLFDITDNSSTSNLSPILEVAAKENEHDLHLSIPAENRDYVVELGYVTKNGNWLKIDQSNPIHVPSGTETVKDSRAKNTPVSTTKTVKEPVENINPTLPKIPSIKSIAEKFTPTVSATLGGTAATLSSVLKWQQEEKETSITPEVNDNIEEPNPISNTSRIILVPRYFRDAYTYWEITDDQKEAARRQGGKNLTLRICDITDIDPNQYPPHRILRYDCEENYRDRHITVPDSGDYVAEIGYITEDDHWIKLATSDPVHIPTSSAR